MSEWDELHEYASTVLGEDALNRLILLERAANQRHWAQGLRNALQPTTPEQLKKPGQILRVVHVIEAMEKEADRYDSSRETT